MAIKKTIRIEADVDQAISEIDQLNNKLDQTDSEAEKASTSLKDVGENGGAIATLDRLTGGLASQIRDAAQASQLFNKRLKLTRAAIIGLSTAGVLAILTAIVVAWQEISEGAGRAEKNARKFLDLYTGTAGVLDAKLKLIQAQIELADTQGRNVDELRKKEGLLLKQQEANARIRIKQLEIIVAQRKQAAANLTLLEKFNTFAKTSVTTVGALIAKITGDQELADQLAGFGDGVVDAILPNGEDDVQALSEAAAELENLKAELVGINIEQEKSKQLAEEGQAGGIVEALGIEAEGVADVGEDPKVKFAEAQADALIGIDVRLKQRLDKNQEEFDKKEFARKEALEKQKIALTAQTFGAISGILGEASAAGKAFAVGQALINTYLGITEVLSTKSTLPEPLATISRIANIATVTAAGFQAVRQISATQVSGFGAGAGSAGATPAAPAAPSFNIVGSAEAQLAEINANTGQEQQPVRAYVVSKDVTSAQELDRNIQNNASL